jgi:hypothetical protein
VRPKGAEREERRTLTEMTTPWNNGEAPLPRHASRGLLPSTWTGCTLKIEYTAADGLSVTTTGALLEYYPFGPVLKCVEGEKVALSLGRISLLELREG